MNILGLIKEYIMVNSIKISYKDLGKCIGQMAENIMENFTIIKSMVLVHFIGLMVKDMKENGNKINNQVPENITHKMDQWEVAIGMMVLGPNGNNDLILNNILLLFIVFCFWGQSNSFLNDYSIFFIF